MGSFSWLRAETTTKRANLTDGDKYKILVPEKFGGGFIKDVYFDYGLVFDDVNDSNRYYQDGFGGRYKASNFKTNDLYGILAYWNGCEGLSYDGRTRPLSMFEILKYGRTTANRVAGIGIGCYDEQINKLKYPLKLVSASYAGTYEECIGRSYGDPNQGFYAAKWDTDAFYWKAFDKLRKGELLE